MPTESCPRNERHRAGRVVTAILAATLAVLLGVLACAAVRPTVLFGCHAVGEAVDAQSGEVYRAHVCSDGWILGEPTGSSARELPDGTI